MDTSLTFQENVHIYMIYLKRNLAIYIKYFYILQPSSIVTKSLVLVPDASPIMNIRFEKKEKGGLFLC